MCVILSHTINRHATIARVFNEPSDLTFAAITVGLKAEDMQFCHIMTLIGIVAGLTAATLQSLSYLFSRGFVMRQLGSPIKLILVSQVFMALLSLPVFAITRGPDLPSISAYILPLFLATAFYTVGQACLFIVMRTVQASRVAPMLGFKIVILAIISAALMGVEILPRQWIGVAIATIGVAVLNFSGGRLSARSTFALFLACVAYSFSDIYIRVLIDALAPLPILRASFYAASASYIMCGSFSCIVLLIRRELSHVTKGIRFSMPYAICWLAGMFALFTCFGSVGPVLGNILQSSRGIISILIAIPAVRLGFGLIEPASPRRVMVQRLTSAALIVLAVWLYVSN